MLYAGGFLKINNPPSFISTFFCNLEAMITSTDFDHFLKNGFIEGLPARTPMHVLLTQYGNDYFYIQHVESNGLIYGIIKIGFIEFHIYDEMVSGISYRPDLYFPKKDFKGVDMPWIYKNRPIDKVEQQLLKRGIDYKKYTVQGPMNPLEVAAGAFYMEEGESTFIDTIGGVTFVFDENENGLLETRQVCKYYNSIYKRTNTPDA